MVPYKSSQRNNALVIAAVGAAVLCSLGGILLLFSANSDLYIHGASTHDSIKDQNVTILMNNSSSTTQQQQEQKLSFLRHRKLLQSSQDDQGAGSNRINDLCSRDDIVVYQGPTTPLPNGIPTYTVQVLNVCVSGRSISNIHVSCGWFSSARMINPSVFRRLCYDDCLANNGEPLGPGDSLSFQYANSFEYPLSVSYVSCY